MAKPKKIGTGKKGQRRVLILFIVIAVSVLISLRKNIKTRNDAVGKARNSNSYILQEDEWGTNPNPNPLEVVEEEEEEEGEEEEGGGGGGGDDGLEYDFYRETCPEAEAIVRSAMARVYSHNKSVPPALLRLFFHDCFIKGCDASVLLDDSNGNKSHSIEKQAPPNRTLKGFEVIDMIKEELENVCPGVVSCADTLALATRDGIAMSGGPFYPVFTGRRDSVKSYFDEASAEIPKPDDHINQTLKIFSIRGFDVRETVSLLGAHNVGKISCEFFQNRFLNFSGTGKPDPSMASDFRDQMRRTCQVPGATSSVPDGASAPMFSGGNGNSTLEMMFLQGLEVSILSGTQFDSHYYQNLHIGRGVLFADQQLMADEGTKRIVNIYASDDGTTFRRDFARAMVRMSNLGVLNGNEGQVRTQCTQPISQS